MQAIKRGHAYYHPETKKFTWKEEPTTPNTGTTNKGSTK